MFWPLLGAVIVERNFHENFLQYHIALGQVQIDTGYNKQSLKKLCKKLAKLWHHYAVFVQHEF